jgi:transposase
MDVQQEGGSVMVRCPRCFRNALYDRRDDAIWCLSCGPQWVNERPLEVQKPKPNTLLARRQEQLMGFMRTQRHPLTADQIAKATGIPVNYTYHLLNVLLNRGLVRRIGRGVRGSARRWISTEIGATPGDDAWSMTEAAQVLGVSYRWVKKMARKYNLGWKNGPYRLLSEEEMEMLRAIKEQRADIWFIGRLMVDIRTGHRATEEEMRMAAEAWREVYKRFCAHRFERYRQKRAAVIESQV